MASCEGSDSKLSTAVRVATPAPPMKGSAVPATRTPATTLTTRNSASRAKDAGRDGPRRSDAGGSGEAIASRGYVGYGVDHDSASHPCRVGSLAAGCQEWLRVPTSMAQNDYQR